MEQIYAKIKNGKVVGKLQATQEYVDSYTGDDVYILLEAVPDYEKETLLKAEARKWRNTELDKYDARSLVTDDPDISYIIEYRRKLRDWPSTSDFPNIKPTIKPVSSPDESEPPQMAFSEEDYNPPIWPLES